jgi:hypothetical protein
MDTRINTPTACTCYKGHRDALDGITTSIAGCAIHGDAAAAPAGMHITDLTCHGRQS